MKSLKLKWSRRTAGDLLSIKSYIAHDNPVRSRKHVALLRKSISRALRFPHSGRIVPEFSNTAIREFILKNYRIVYWVNNKIVTVLTVFEGYKLLNIDENE